MFSSNSSRNGADWSNGIAFGPWAFWTTSTVRKSSNRQQNSTIATWMRQGMSLTEATGCNWPSLDLSTFQSMLLVSVRRCENSLKHTQEAIICVVCACFVCTVVYQKHGIWQKYWLLVDLDVDLHLSGFRDNSLLFVLLATSFCAKLAEHQKVKVFSKSNVQKGSSFYSRSVPQFWNLLPLTSHFAEHLKTCPTPCLRNLHVRTANPKVAPAVLINERLLAKWDTNRAKKPVWYLGTSRSIFGAWDLGHTWSSSLEWEGLGI